MSYDNKGLIKFNNNMNYEFQNKYVLLMHRFQVSVIMVFFQTMCIKIKIDRIKTEYSPLNLKTIYIRPSS